MAMGNHHFIFSKVEVWGGGCFGYFVDCADNAQFNFFFFFGVVSTKSQIE